MNRPCVMVSLIMCLLVDMPATATETYVIAGHARIAETVLTAMLPITYESDTIAIYLLDTYRSKPSENIANTAGTKPIVSTITMIDGFIIGNLGIVLLASAFITAGIPARSGLTNDLTLAGIFTMNTGYTIFFSGVFNHCRGRITRRCLANLI